MSRLQFSRATEAKLLESRLDVVVTGCGGWLGQATLEMLESSLGAQFASRVHGFASSARTLKLRSGTEFGVSPLGELQRVKPAPTSWLITRLPRANM